MKGAKLTVDGKVAKLQVIAPIDEKFEFPDQINCDLVVVDLELSTRINSFGVRLWLVWVKEKKGFHQVRLENCHAAFINQARHIPNFIPPYVHVESFYVPFFDAEAGEDIETKMIYGKDYDEKGYRIPVVKNGNGVECTLDTDEGYFSFLKTQST